jgi:hypothetical protein
VYIFISRATVVSLLLRSILTIHYVPRPSDSIAVPFTSQRNNLLQPQGLTAQSPATLLYPVPAARTSVVLDSPEKPSDCRSKQCLPRRDIRQVDSGMETRPACLWLGSRGKTDETPLIQQQPIGIWTMILDTVFEENSFVQRAETF